MTESDDALYMVFCFIVFLLICAAAWLMGPLFLVIAVLVLIIALAAKKG